MKISDRIINKPFLGQTPAPSSSFGYELLQKWRIALLNFIQWLQLLRITQVEPKNLLEWLLARLHRFWLDELHLTAVNQQNFKSCCQVLPVQNIGMNRLAEGEKPITDRVTVRSYRKINLQ